MAAIIQPNRVQPKFNAGLNNAKYNPLSTELSKLCKDGKHRVCYSLKCGCACHNAVGVAKKAKA